MALRTALTMPIERLRGRSILHVHTASGKSFVRKAAFIRWGRFLGYKVIFHSHCGASKDYFRSIGIPKARRTLELASSIVVLSQSWKEYYESTFHFSDVHILNNPVYIPVAPASPASSESRCSSCFSARSATTKAYSTSRRIHQTRRQMARTRQAHDRRHGRGRTARQANTRIRAWRHDRIHRMGHRRRKEKAFAASHILILPSYFEGLPVSILGPWPTASPSYPHP